MTSAYVLMSKPSDGATALHLAAEAGNLNAIDAFISAGADLEASDQSGARPLHYAAGAGKPLAVLLLLERGANPLAKDANGRTPKVAARWAGAHRVQIQETLNSAERRSRARERTPPDSGRRV